LEFFHYKTRKKSLWTKVNTILYRQEIGEFCYLATTAPVLHPLIKLTSELA